MKDSTKKIVERFQMDNPKLSEMYDDINHLALMMVSYIKQGAKILICGNGGSASDSDHIVGELMKGFDKKRPLDIETVNRFKVMYGASGEVMANKLQQGIPAISLTQHLALNTATINDIDPELMFAQQVIGLGNKGDILIGISTSGNASNVINALKTAKIKGLLTVGLTGKTGGQFLDVCDVTLVAPSYETYRVQEFHLAIYHFLCLYIESELFDL